MLGQFEFWCVHLHLNRSALQVDLDLLNVLWTPFSTLYWLNWVDEEDWWGGGWLERRARRTRFPILPLSRTADSEMRRVVTLWRVLGGGEFHTRSTTYHRTGGCWEGGEIHTRSTTYHRTGGCWEGGEFHTRSTTYHRTGGCWEGVKSTPGAPPTTGLEGAGRGWNPHQEHHLPQDCWWYRAPSPVYSCLCLEGK